MGLNTIQYGLKGVVIFQLEYTSPPKKNNIEPENRPLEKEIPFGKAAFSASISSMFVFGRVMMEKTYTPLKINMEHNHGGLEDHFPF